MAQTSRKEIITGLSEDFSRPATTIKRDKQKIFLSPEERKKIMDADPWEALKKKYKVNLSELLKIDTTEKGNNKLAVATKYLLFDNFFDEVMVNGIEALKEENIELPSLSGEEQIIYFWLYRKSYGFGYRACPMSHNELGKKLRWSKNTVRKHLKSLQEKGVIKPILFPYKNQRATVYEVVFPRILLQEKLNQVDEDRRDVAATKAMDQIKKKLNIK